MILMSSFVLKHGKSNGSNFEIFWSTGLQHLVLHGYQISVLDHNLPPNWPRNMILVSVKTFWGTGNWMVAMSKPFDHLLTHKQVLRRWFLAWLNAAQLVFFLFYQNFQKQKNAFLIDLEWSILAKGKVAISKTVPTAAVRYIIIIHTYIHNTNRI